MEDPLDFSHNDYSSSPPARITKIENLHVHYESPVGLLEIKPRDVLGSVQDHSPHGFFHFHPSPHSASSLRNFFLVTHQRQSQYSVLRQSSFFLTVPSLQEATGI